MAKVSFEVGGLAERMRLDKALRGQYPDWGRQAVKQILNRRQVRVNGRAVWLGSWQVENGDRIEVENPPAGKPQGPERFDDGWMLAEEEDLIVVNKPAGLRSQATRAGGQDNLLDLATARFGALHLFHRLDRDTSGVCLLTRPGPVNAYLDGAFKQRRVEKGYIALVATGGRLETTGVISERLKQHPKRRDKMVVTGKGGQRTETHYEVVGEAGGLQLVRLRPITGRTHQLRVHLAHLGTAVVGDRLYGGGEKQAGRLMLHAYAIGLPEAEGFPARQYTAAPGANFLAEVPKKLRPYVDLV